MDQIKNVYSTMRFRRHYVFAKVRIPTCGPMSFITFLHYETIRLGICSNFSRALLSFRVPFPMGTSKTHHSFFGAPRGGVLVVTLFLLRMKFRKKRFHGISCLFFGRVGYFFLTTPFIIRAHVLGEREKDS